MISGDDYRELIELLDKQFGAVNQRLTKLGLAFEALRDDQRALAEGIVAWRRGGAVLHAVRVTRGGLFESNPQLDCRAPGGFALYGELAAMLGRSLPHEQEAVPQLWVRWSKPDAVIRHAKAEMRRVIR